MRNRLGAHGVYARVGILRAAAVSAPIASVLVVDPAGWYPFGPAKWGAVSVVLGLLGVGLARQRDWTVPRVLGGLWLVLLTLIVVAAALGRDGWYAWAGTPERHLGAITWFGFAVAFIAGVHLDSLGVRLLARSAAVTAVATGVYVGLERIGRAPIETASVSERWGGPLGSAAFLGAAGCLLLPVSAALAADRDERRPWRLVGGAGALGVIVAVVGSGARAAWVGLAVAAVVAAVAGRPSWRTMLAGAGGLALALVLVGGRLPAAVERSVGPASRLDEWAMAVDVVTDHRLLGVGPEGYRLAIGDVMTDDYERRYGREVMPDRAHSGVLDVAVTAGLPAAAVYVAVLGAVMAAAVTVLRRRPPDPLLAGGAVAMMAYVVQQQLLFPLAELDPLAWLLAGVVVAQALPTMVVVSVPGGLRRTAVAAAAVAVLVTATAGALDVVADRTARRSLRADSPSAAVAAAEAAVRWRPDVVRYRLVLAVAERSTGTVAGARGAASATAAARRWSPQDPLLARRHAEAALRVAQLTGTADDVADAQAAWSAVVASDPACFDCHLQQGVAAAMAGDRAGAEAAWARAAELTSDDPRPREWSGELMAAD